MAAVGDGSLVRVCDVTTGLDCRVEGSDGARNSIARNSINHHRTRIQITQNASLGKNKPLYHEVFYQTNRQTDGLPDKYAERKTAKH